MWSRRRNTGGSCKANESWERLNKKMVVELHSEFNVAHKRDNLIQNLFVADLFESSAIKSSN